MECSERVSVAGVRGFQGFLGNQHQGNAPGCSGGFDAELVGFGGWCCDCCQGAVAAILRA